MMPPSCNRRLSHQVKTSSPVEVRECYDSTKSTSSNRGRYSDDESRSSESTIPTDTSATASSSSIFSTPTSNSNPHVPRVPFSSVLNSNPTLSSQSSQQQRRQSQHLDWKVKSIVRRSSSIVQTEVAHRIANSPFLMKQQEDNSKPTNIPLFHRNEVQIGKMIGSGGFSNVYQITELILDPTISQRCTLEQQERRTSLSNLVNTGRVQLVIKHLKRKMALSSTKEMSHAACDLMMEASYMSELNHPNILPVRGLPIDSTRAYDSGDFDGYFIIMDELSNTLSDEILNWQKNVCDAPSIEVKTDYAVQIASAINYLHVNCNMIFRDLKPQNIGFDAQTGTIQLFDFGLCRDLPSTSLDNDDEVYEMSGVGTRRYMAPEIINDNRYNAKVDVYSWAMVFIEMLTGHKPYAKYDVEDHRIAVCQGGERPRIHMFWPTYIRTVLQKSWCESVSSRWSMQDVLLFLARSVLPVPRRSLSVALPSSSLSMFDSPIAVEQINTFYVLPTSTSILLPELPDLQNCSDDNSHSSGTEITSAVVTQGFRPNIPQLQPNIRRHTIFPNMIMGRNMNQYCHGVDYNYDDKDCNTSDVFVNDSDYFNNNNGIMRKSPHLTICKDDGTVEIVESVDQASGNQYKQRHGSPSIHVENPQRRSCPV